MVFERNRIFSWYVLCFDFLIYSETDLVAQRRLDVTQGDCYWKLLLLALFLTSLLSPDEYPFTDDLPEPVLPPLHFPKILHPNKINANRSILSFYINAIIPRISRRATLALPAHKGSREISGGDEFEDDGHYGSAATLDVEVLQSISKRVHYGKSSNPVMNMI